MNERPEQVVDGQCRNGIVHPSECDPRQRFMDRIAGTYVTGDFEPTMQRPGPQPVPGNPGGPPVEKCLYCSAPMIEIEGARFQCTSCGIIQ